MTYFLIEEHTVTGKQRVVITSRKKKEKNHRTAKKSDLTIPYIQETNLRLYFIQMWMDTFPVLNMEFIYGHKFS